MKIFEDHINLTDIDISSIPHSGDMLLFDIETTGLKKEISQIYLIGCGYFENDELVIKQWLAEMTLDEPDVIESFMDLARKKSILVHFNGDGFDIPFTEYKADYYGIDSAVPRMDSLDLYLSVKPAKKLLGLERMNQKSIEGFMGVERRDMYNGGQLIHVYHEYERTGREEDEEKLLLHNYEDVLGMAKMFSMMPYAQIFNGGYSFESSQIFNGVVISEYRMNKPVPKEAEYICDGLHICADGDLLQINADILDGDIKIPVSDYENYFYLPEEDTVVHKDVAQFVDKKHRKKATRKNCFMRVRAEQLVKADAEFFLNYAKNIISNTLS